MSITVTATDGQYHRIISSNLRIPTDASTGKPIPVGLLACQRDPLLRQLQTPVISSVKHEPPSAPVGKKTKKAVIAPELIGPLREVVLFDTVIFPEGGGQPTDVGIITTAEGKEYEVVQAKRHGGHAVHYVQCSLEEDPFQPNTTVTVSLNDKGWGRRYDHMTMHTSQHLLSALLESRLNVPTLSWSLTAFPTPCYVELPRAVSLEEIGLVQAEANRLVFEDRKIHVEVQELDEGVSSTTLKTEDGRAIGKALPSDYTGGVKRVIVIDGVDRNPCCGTHKPSLANLQLFLLPQQDSVSRAATATTRLYFLAGPRLINHLTTTHSLLANTAFSLSCGAPQVPDRVSLLMEERKRAEKRLEDVELSLAGYIAKDLVNDNQGIFKRYIHRTDDSSNSLGFLSSISTAFLDQVNGKSDPYLVVMSSSPSSQNASSQTVVLVFGSNEELIKTVGGGLKAKLDVKGGGKGPRWSGKFAGVWKPKKAEESIKEIFESL